MTHNLRFDQGSPTVYCKKCRYWLIGLVTNRCPECGRAFDLSDSRTYSGKPRSSRRRWIWAAVVAGLAAVCWYIARYHFEVATVKLDCTACGRERIEYEVLIFDHRVLRRTLRENENGLCQFMVRAIGPHEHTWAMEIRCRYSYTGQEFLPRTLGPAEHLGVVSVFNWNVDELERLRAIAPDLPSSIQNDILRGTSPTARLAVRRLISRCRNSTDPERVPPAIEKRLESLP